MDKLITINLSYYNQSKETVLKHINYWNNYDKHTKRKFTFFIIDDCSKIPINELLKGEYFKNLDIHFYRVEEDLKYNIGGVRNLGAKECNTDWYVILDMDTLISPVMAKELVNLAENNRDNKKAFKFNRKVINNESHKKNNKIHPAICLIEKDIYWKIGGCDEDFVGNYGWTDPHFWWRSKGIIEIVEKRDIYIEYIEEGECDMERDNKENAKLFQEKKKNDSWSVDIIRFGWKKLKI